MHKKTGVALVVMLSLVGVVSASSFVTKKLDGTYAVYENSPIDPDPREGLNTHMYFYLAGEAAESLFHAMKENAVRDECVDDGSLSKLSQDIVCTQSPDMTYECSFSVNIVEHKLSFGRVC